MTIQCRACWTLFAAALAEREPGTRKLICPACADCGDSVLPREEWTPEEVAEVTPEAPAPASRVTDLRYVFTLKIEGDVEEIDVMAGSREEAWRKAEEVRADLYGGAGTLRSAN